MNRRQFVSLGPALFARPTARAEQSQPIAEPHFPSRLHLFVWRNWELANAERMAQVVRTRTQNILELGSSMGLPKKRRLTADQLKRIYITVIRQNWQVLPERQIIELLGWDRKKFAFTLKEDDFLGVKLGPKPECPELTYAVPSAEERKRAAAIRKIVRQTLGPAIDEPGERLFHFVEELSDARYASLRDPCARRDEDEIDLSAGWELRAPREGALAGASRRFREYLETAMGARLGQPSSGTIRIGISDGAASGEFQIQAGDSEVRITGGDDDAARQALYFLQDRMEERGAPFLKKGSASRKTAWNPRYLYSYFALYGDPLMEPEIDPFPDGYLEKLARAGINGVWMQAVLNTLAPSDRFPEFGAGWERRLGNLNKLVERAGQFGVKVYLYLNEPRAMPAAFFEKHPEARGRSEAGLYAMCTSVPAVRQWLADSLAHIVKQAPGLGGFFTITMSENLTNCFSHGGTWGKGAPNAGDCPRCGKRKSWDVLAELLRTFRDGIRRSSASAELINWDWGWGDELAQNLIPLLPRDTRFLSMSEWDRPVERGGVKTEAHEYSISVVGPGPRALRNWEQARQQGVAAMAKVQLNNTWEISAVPYIPVMHLILEHCENLSRAGISGIMASWTCGGYASPNLAGAKAYYLGPSPSRKEVLAGIAARRYGKEAAPEMIEGWRRFSEAFQEFPYGVAIYTIPTQHGPANLLRFRPTGYHASMMLFPHDDLDAWRGVYPAEAVFEQFTRLAAGWKKGLEAFRAGLAKVTPAKRGFAETDLAIAETCYNHFQSVANQVEFYLVRARLGQAEKKPALARMRALAEQEIELAKRQYAIARRHSTIGYEASNHYYYAPLDLVEKILNCRHILDSEIPAYEA